MRWLWAFLLAFTSLQSREKKTLEHLVYEIRDPATDRKPFRKALEKIGEYIALDIKSELVQKTHQIETLTGEAAVHEFSDEAPVLVTILRAGLPLCYGAQKVFPSSEVGFIAMSRNEETLIADVSYIALPDVRDRSVIIVDTMIATAGSLLNAVKILEERQAKQIIILGAIAAQYGMDQIAAYNPNIKVFVATVDPLLNDKGYIVPGLGDAGDRCFGPKVQ
ncbi:MAG TPA: uracil phosphoribosyltransferase [Chlamydiales bacterium]|nr:uracil phosphoribosyltransferase [Chlamydiales bacterium]